MGTDSLAPVRELRQLVDGLHAAGLSVVMQVHRMQSVGVEGFLVVMPLKAQMSTALQGGLCMHALIATLARRMAPAVTRHH